ncbi:MAG TPA: DCC1-like thiol-disulfide oxidoreductase family protein [Terriglobales bacterium]|nr:DCC1-like thiol-disulfide oxidoreductase family protein [Terriglobales bacterium]
MISLVSDMTDRKGRHAHGWLFFDAECALCRRIARWLARPMHRRGMALAPLQDPRVGALLGLTRAELLREIRYVTTDGTQTAGADAVLAVLREIWWAQPIVWMSALPGALPSMRAAYRWISRHSRCPSHRYLGTEIARGCD